MAALPQKPAESSRALGAGLTFAVTVALFAFGGSWLDAKLSTGPWLVLLGALLGVVGGAIHLIAELAPETLGLSRRPLHQKAPSSSPSPPAPRPPAEPPSPPTP